MTRQPHDQFAKEYLEELLTSLGTVETSKDVKSEVRHKDRMCRFAFDFIMELASSVGCQIIVANQESLSPQQELVEDLMAIIHCFSCRLYGLRNYSKEIKDNLKNAIDKPIQDVSNLDNKEIQC
jgi:predicted site-specific integrase-resolvase